MQAAYPYIGILLSAEILTELADPGRDMEHLFFLALALVGLNFLGKRLIDFCSQVLEVMKYTAMKHVVRTVAEKAWKMDYALSADPEINETKERITHWFYGRGIMALSRQLLNIFQALLTIAISAALVVEFFRARAVGEGGMAVYTVCDNVLMIVEMITAGIIGVIPNIAGILYGEKDYFGIRALCKRVLVLSAAATLCIFVLVMVFAKSITVMFGVDNSALSSMMVTALRIFILCLPAYVWNKFLVGYYESIEESKQASIITFFQNGIYVLPAAALGVILEVKMGGGGINGLALSFVCSEILTVLTAYLYRKIKHRGADFYLLPEETGICFDFTVKADMDETALVPREVKKFCIDHGISANKANIVAMAAEEMIVNCIKYGGRLSHWIDVSLVIEKQKMLLRIRDNGVPFNPTEYEFDSGKFDIHGIEVVKTISSDISYMRTMDLNNTVLEFDIEQEEEK